MFCPTILTINTKQKPIRVVVKTTAALNRAIRKQNGTEKILVRVTTKKICIKIFSTFLPVSSFSKSYESSWGWGKLEWLDRNEVRISGWTEKSFLLQCNQSNLRFMPFTWPVYKLQDNKSTKSKQDVQGSCCVSWTPPLGCRCETPKGVCSNFQSRWCICWKWSRTNYKTRSHNKIYCLASCPHLQRAAGTCKKTFVRRHNPRLLFSQVLVMLAQSLSAFPSVTAKAA